MRDPADDPADPDNNTFVIVAEATDNLGNITTSAPVTVVVATKHRGSSVTQA